MEDCYRKRCQEVLEKMLLEYTQELESCISKAGLPIEEDSPVNTGASPVSLFGLHRSILLSKTDSLLKQVGHFINFSVLSSDGYNCESLSAELDHNTAVLRKKRQIFKASWSRERK